MDVKLLLLGLVYTIIVAQVGGDAESDDMYRKIQKLYEETADDNMSCWFHISEEAKLKCQEKKLLKKHELLAAVKEAEEKHILKAKTECGAHRTGYADYDIGVQFSGDVELPCDEHAFDKPKHTAAEYDAMNYKLLDLWNKYNSMCFQGLHDMFSSEKVNCDEQKWIRGQALAKEIQFAEQNGYIDKNCQADGIGSYSFTQGMDPTDMPCKPMPEGTKYGDPGTIKQS